MRMGDWSWQSLTK